MSETRRYKIVAIMQMHNELRKGNLPRFFTYIQNVVDAVVVYDDASSDGSFEYAQKRTPYVIRGTRNNFANEWQHKDLLLKKALELQPDFILSIDADEIVADQTGEKLQQLGVWVHEQGLDGALIHDINLWRSANWCRTDRDYNDAYFPRFWKVTPGMGYAEPKPGLHRSPAPDTVQKVKRTDIVSFIHYGFATDRAIVNKYLTYAHHGQRGENLARLLDEDGLKLAEVDKKLFPEGLWHEDPKPVTRPLSEWLSLAESLRSELLKPAISIVCLIYKSTEWLQFVWDQVRKYTDLHDKEFFFIANDASPDVLAYLKDNYIPHYVFTNTPEHLTEWYINNVYRAWNFGARQAKGDYVLFVNSDMAFSPGWVENLFRWIDDTKCVCSRLVESGRLATGGLCIEKNFGQFIDEYKEQEFLDYVKSISEEKLVSGGAYMPLLIKRDHFISVGGYPEGNAVAGSDIFNPTIAKKGEDLVSGDIIFMEKLKTKGVYHHTAFNSLTYHFQEGEQASSLPEAYSDKDVTVAVVNNSLVGAMGEKVMWQTLVEALPKSAGVDIKMVQKEVDFEIAAQQYITEHYPKTEYIIQNASFIDLIDPNKYTIAYLQDDLRKMNKMSLQQEQVLEGSHLLVANSFDTAASYPEYYFKVLPIGINESLFAPRERQAARKAVGINTTGRVGIFVGDLSPVKGWPEIEQLIDRHPEIIWIVVSKGVESYDKPNVKLYNRISQEQLAGLYSCADFFIIGSRVESQCLAAMEACFCGVPVIMRRIGIFAHLTEQELDQCGIFGDNFEQAIVEIGARTFNPRSVMLARGFGVRGMVEAWWQLLSELALGKTAPQVPKKVLGRTPRSVLRKARMILSNKNYIQTSLRRNLPMPLYTIFLKGWRVAKKIKAKLH